MILKGALIYGQCPDPDIEQEGVCERVSYRCNRMLRPVCGCDGATYSNNSCTKGVNIASDGPCDSDDGSDATPGRRGRIPDSVPSIERHEQEEDDEE